MEPQKTNSFQHSISHYTSHLKADLPASLIVFLVAVPLCLGIALASGAPLFSGIIAGIVGGILVGALSGSQLGVSGPAAGLAVIVLNSITELGAFDAFLLAVMLAGVIQILLGIAKAGIIGYYFPNSVIKGMLAGIGIIIILKQIPHGFGFDRNRAGDFSFLEADGQNTFSMLYEMLGAISPGATLVFLLSLAILILWERPFMRKFKIFQVIQGPLVVVVTAIVLNLLLSGHPVWGIQQTHLVSLPVANSFSEFLGFFTFPDFSQLTNSAVYVVAFTLAIVASLETLLCVEATDKLDPEKRITPTNRELFAQGAGNVVSGLIGGLPITQVIVRSSTNIQSGGKTKISAILHGVLLLVCALTIPAVLNLIPLSSLAAILILVGYKLAKPALFASMFRLGWYQFIPFTVTIGAIVFTDLLTGILIGMAVAVLIILRESARNTYFLKADDVWEDGRLHIQLSEELHFIKKGRILNALNEIPNGAKVTIDGSRTVTIDQDVLEIIEDFKEHARRSDIDLELIGFPIEKQTDPVQMLKKTIKEKPHSVFN